MKTWDHTLSDRDKFNLVSAVPDSSWWRSRDSVRSNFCCPPLQLNVSCDRQFFRNIWAVDTMDVIQRISCRAKLHLETLWNRNNVPFVGVHIQIHHGFRIPSTCTPYMCIVLSRKSLSMGIEVFAGGHKTARQIPEKYLCGHMRLCSLSYSTYQS